MTVKLFAIGVRVLRLPAWFDICLPLSLFQNHTDRTLQYNFVIGGVHVQEDSSMNFATLLTAWIAKLERLFHRNERNVKISRKVFLKFRGTVFSFNSAVSTFTIFVLLCTIVYLSVLQGNNKRLSRWMALKPMQFVFSSFPVTSWREMFNSTLPNRDWFMWIKLQALIKWRY